MRAEVLQEIAAMLDHPNVYMGGPSQRNMRRAEQIYAAVAPLIAAAERERCARVADGTPYHGRYRTWPWWANPDGSQGNRENESDVVRHADAIAAAIRALSHEENSR